MNPTKTRPRKTVEDFMKLPDGVRAELIEGEIFMSPSPREIHQRVASNLHYSLRSFVEPRGLGRVYVAPFDVHLPSGDIVEPDLIFVSAANRHIIQDWIRGVPDLLVEIVSPEGMERDRIVKRGLYERNGVPEYWIVETETRTVEILTRPGGRYAPHGYFEESDTIDSRVLDGLALPVQEIFA